MIREVQYYISHFIALDSCGPVQTTHENINTGSPLIVMQWIKMLQNHPVKTYVQFYSKGYTAGM